ncbi:GLUG motif-containing protein [Agrobacterium tumefaciens]|uniref:GLUG motif-containing protein n=1 Tax=Agrobacterium tumefaciens TaxID=358 RepID=UPI000976F9BE|nr:hypothetical protein BV900_28045 [Agrobacterium tumefaciens]
MAADNLPSGGQVVSGSVTIDTSGPTTTITQGSDKAIVNWNAFSVGKGNSVNFVQPNSGSAILNRVTGSTTSTIAGSLTANGQVYLINPNGIAITPTGKVKVGGGFMASTLDINNDDFLKGQYRFNGYGASAAVSNEGVITVGRSGYAALIGGTVKNDGLIAVPMGKVGLGSGEQATLDLSGDGFLQVAVPTKDRMEGNGALIENSGTISADGGTVVMRAATARTAARHAINLSGVVEADSISGHDGAITIGGGEGGKVSLSGKVSSKSASGKGGKITITGKNIALKGATVNASGTRGGGTVKIGGDRQGMGTTQHAETVSIDKASTIHADATQSGNGGDITVWSDQTTSFAGLITALGADRGTGGDAEVSGKAVLDYRGSADLRGAGGFGTLLLDPYNLSITNTVDVGMSGFNANANDSVLNFGVLISALATANVTVTTGFGGNQAGNISVANAVTWSSGSELTLSAYGSITVNANLTGGSGSSIVLRSDNSGTGNGTVSFGSDVKVTASDVVLYYNPAGNDASSVNSTSYTHSTDYSGYAGAGTTITGYMLVNSVYDLQNVQNKLDGAFAVGRDIDASRTASWNSGAGFKPIGDSSAPFTGTFDGLGHTITGLTIDRPTTDYVGLFGYTGSGSAISSLGLVDGSVTGRGGVGGLAGRNEGDITQSYATSHIKGSDIVGGLIGSNSGSVIKSYAIGSVTGSSTAIGGLVGFNSGSINKAYATGSVTGSAVYVGGLVGSNTGAINNSYATGAVAGSHTVGGLVGSNTGTTIDNSYATGAVTSSGPQVGGLIGFNNRTITSSFFDMDTTGQTHSVGYGVGRDQSATGITGLTTAQARDASSYTGWDFTTDWYQSADMRPIGRWEAAQAGADGVAIVGNTHQLVLIDTNPAGKYALAANLDASETVGTNAAGIWGAGGFTPIGNGTARFTGTFDGQGHVISGLTINRPTTNSVGLFGSAGSGSIIRGVGLVGGSVTGLNYVGGLVGFINNGGTITEAYAIGSVTGQSYVGGLVGYNNSSVINSYANGSVTGNSNVGGLVGLNNFGIITQAYATGNVKGDGNNIGGLVGRSNGGSIGNSYASGGVTGSGDVGGLVGFTEDSSISRSYATGSLTGSGEVGGLVGYNGGSISNSYATGSVTGSYNVGGLVGYNYNSITASFYDKETTYQASGIGGGKLSGVTGLTTAQMHDGSITSNSFYGLASAAGWDFTTIWSRPNAVARQSSDGQLHYAELYATSGVVGVNATGSMTYGDSSPIVSLTYYGTDNSYGNTVTVDPTSSLNATTNAGTYIGALTGGSGISWGGRTTRFVYSGTTTVTPATLTITAGNGSMVYGDRVPGLSYSVSGWKNGQSDNLLSGVNVTTNATSTSDVGSYTTTAASGSLTGAATGNYTLAYTGGAFTVTAAALTVAAGNGTMVHGGSVPSLTYSVSGWKNGQSDSLLAGVNVMTTATPSSDVGSYTTTASGGTLTGAATGNYTLAYTQGRLVVQQVNQKPAVSETSGSTLVWQIDTPALKTPQSVVYATPDAKEAILTTQTLSCPTALYCSAR